MTQREIILRLLREDVTKWWCSYELIKVATKYGWLGTSADRVCRRLAEDGIIEKRDKGQYIQFKAKGPKEVVEYRVNGELVSSKTIWT